MRITRREMCHSLVLLPFATQLGSCEDNPLYPTILVVIFNYDKNPYYVFTSASKSGEGVSVAGGSKSAPATATGNVRIPDDVAANFLINVVKAKTDSLAYQQGWNGNEIVSESGKPIGANHFYVEIRPSTNLFVAVTVQAQPGAGH